MSTKIKPTIDSFLLFNGTVKSSYTTSNVFWDRRMVDNEQYRMNNIRFGIVSLWGIVRNIVNPDGVVLVSFARVKDTGVVKNDRYDIVQWDPKRHRTVSR